MKTLVCTKPGEFEYITAQEPRPEPGRAIIKIKRIGICGTDLHGENVWSAITKSITTADINNMEIYRTGNRLFMIIEAGDNFSFERKAAMDEANEKVREWEELMWRYQQPLPWARNGEKWILMDKIFEL